MAAARVWNSFKNYLLF